jgi:hypothetical protein
MIELSIKDKSNNYLDNFKNIYRKIDQLRNLEKCYGSLIMTLDLSINPDTVVTRERLFQDYLHECQVLLVEVPSLTEKLAVYLIQKYQHWFPTHVNVDVSEIYDKCFQDNLTLTKNCVLKKSLTYFPMTSRVTMNSNHSNMVRSGISTKGQVISIGNSKDLSNFKEIKTRNYWINNSIDIWNSLTVVLGLKLETEFVKNI